MPGPSTSSPSKVAGLVALLLLTTACGESQESVLVTPAPVATEDPTALFTPWHAADEPSPFPADEQWYWRERLAKAAAPESFADDPEAATLLREALPALHLATPLESEPRLEELLPHARRAPVTLLSFLDVAEPNVRFAAARLLLRLVVGTEVPVPERLAEAAATHLRDAAAEVALLHLESLARAPCQWSLLRLIKTFGRYDNHPRVEVRARAAMHLARRGLPSGMALFLRILKEQTALQDDINRDWSSSLRTAWWKEEALAGIEILSGQRFGFAPDATDPVQVQIIHKIERWWAEHEVEIWSRCPPLEDPVLVQRLQEIILGLGTFQLRNVDNAVFLLEHCGPPVAPLLFEALGGSSFAVRRHCLDLLAVLMKKVPSPLQSEWVAHLRPLLQDPLGAIRHRALVAIGASGRPESLPLLEAALRGEPAAAEVALRALAGSSSPQAQKMLVDYVVALSDESPLWLPAQAARLASGDLAELDRFLELLAGEDGQAARASIYVSWLVEVDDFAEAETPEQRRVAANRLGEELRSRVSPRRP